jgi:hypothetical protein
MNMMQRSPLFDPSSDRLCRPGYEVRVRGTAYLWGSAGLTRDVSFARPLVLHARNALFGEPIGIGTQTVSGTQTDYGTLQPGECISIELQGVSGVYVTCTRESVVGCMIREGG